MSRPRPRLVALSVAVILVANFAVLVPGAAARGRILRVPSQIATLQDAVERSRSGDLILVEPGVYPGDVVVPPSKKGITIRGLDRNKVIFDGKHKRHVAITVRANNVKLENMTARNFIAHGFYWRSVTGYTGRYLTAYNNRLYGIYAFDSVKGRFAKSYASGSGDASFYIGQCRPCDAVITNVIAEHSALGYSGTNAGGNLIIRNSTWRYNATGILPNSLDSQEDPPQRGGTRIVRNVVTDNGNPDTPGDGIAGAIIGHGIGIAGGSENLVQNNLVERNTDYGVVIFPIPGGENVYPPNDNVVRRNSFKSNGGADLALSAGSGTGNCFEGNDFKSSAPSNIESQWACGDGAAQNAPGAGDPGVAANLSEDFAAAQSGANDRPSYADMPVPPKQPTMRNPDPEA